LANVTFFDVMFNDLFHFWSTVKLFNGMGCLSNL
jgi:hypothetical protein